MSKAVSRVLEVIDALLGPEGCPWDKKQTPESLCDYFVEEAFELVEAVRSGDADEAMQELGDLMFLLLFVSRLYADRGEFTLDEALSANAAKMIRRHPHVFADTTFANQGELLKNWERIKREEKAENGEAPGVFDSLPKGLPPLLKAYRIHSKAARSGFTWESDQDLEAQLSDEWREWEEAKDGEDQARKEQEFGDVLFTMVELGRRHSIKANTALDGTNLRFLGRFRRMEAQARAQGKAVADLSLPELNALWDRAKAGE